LVDLMKFPLSELLELGLHWGPIELQPASVVEQAVCAHVVKLVPDCLDPVRVGRCAVAVVLDTGGRVPPALHEFGLFCAGARDKIDDSAQQTSAPHGGAIQPHRQVSGNLSRLEGR